MAPVVEVVHMCSGSPPVDDSTACDEWPTEEAKAGRHVALVMPLATRTLSSVIEEGTLSMEDFVSVVRPVVETVAELHRHGLVYGDMKAENVLQFESLYWKLVDCEHVVDVGSELSGYTEWCMAPEAAWEVVRKGSVRGYGARVVYDSWGVGMVRVVCVRV